MLNYCFNGIGFCNLVQYTNCVIKIVKRGQLGVEGA